MLKTVLDVETLFSLICKEEDADSKHIYFFLFKLLRKSILRPPSTTTATTTTMSPTRSTFDSPLTHISAPTNPASVEAHLGKPPFEDTSIIKAILNFILCKYGPAHDSLLSSSVVSASVSSSSSSNELELAHMFEASKLLLYCLNMWKFETPSCFIRRQVVKTAIATTTTTTKKNSSSSCQQQASSQLSDEQQKLVALYKLNYTRWICYNYAPSFCASLERHETVVIFGVQFLKLVYALVKQEMQDKFIAERDKIPSEKRLVFSNYLPK